MNNPNFSKQRVALITGAARSIGLACAQSLSLAGHRLVLVDRDSDALNAARDVLPDEAALCITADLADPAAAARIAEEISSAGFAGVDILVNNAGISPKHNGRSKTAIDIDDTEWDLVISVNLSAVMRMCRQFLPQMHDRGWGRVVNMASVAGRGVSAISSPAYMASKAGILGLTRNIAVNYGKHGITANAVAPGRIATDMGSHLHPQLIADAESKIPVGRSGRSQEIAAAVAFLCSEDASFCNGAVIDVNGGSFMV